jgi:hypothetical protein
MKLSVLTDNAGKQTSVVIPMEDWMLIKRDYPDIEDITTEMPQWEKDLIDQRLDAIAQNPQRIQSGDALLDELKRK